MQQATDNNHLYASCGTSDSQFQQGALGGGGGGFSLLILQPGNFHLRRDDIMSSLCQLMIFVFTCMYTRAHNKFKYVALFLDMLMFMQQVSYSAI